MSLTYNGADVKEIIYNGNALKQMDYNGVTVFKKDEWSDKPYVSFIEENGNQFRIRIAYRYNNGWTIDTRKPWNGSMYYSIDGETWSTFSPTNEGIYSSSDGKLFLRGTGNRRITEVSNGHYNQFLISSSGSLNIECLGNIENLLDYTVVADGEHPDMDNYCYRYLFRKQSIVKAPELPATLLTTNCYSYMFSECTKLTGQIHLPASVASDSNRLKDTDITGSSATIVFDL